MSIEEEAAADTPTGKNDNEIQPENQAEMNPKGDPSENCKDKIMNFLEKTMKLENAKNIKIEKAFRLGKHKVGAKIPRPVVVKFSNLEDRASVKSASSRLKDTKYGISPHYPREIVERRKKLVPIMLQERKKKKNAYIVGDKLYIEGELWKG